MADRALAIRLAVVDGGKVKAELKDVGEVGDRALRRIETAARPASRALLALDGAAGEVRGSLQGLAGRLGPLGAALTALGPAGLAAGAALAGVGLVLTRGLQEAAQADQSYRRLEAVLRATGQASGLTAREITGFADGLERTTLATAESVQDAASVLATFRSVAGETFTRALTLAQDLSAVFGQDLSASATQLGKALEEPVQGITALRRVGVSFTASQRELIASLIETGQTAQAQKVILDALEQQVGGAGAAEAGGLTGAANRLADAWGNLLEAIGQTPAVSGAAEGALGLLSRAMEGLTTFFDEQPIAERIVAANRELLAAEDELARLKAGGPGTPLIGQRQFLAEQEAKVAALRQEVENLLDQARGAADSFAGEQRAAAAGQRAAEAERLAEQVATQRRELDRQLEQLATGPGERVARVNRELEETRRKLTALRAPDGSNQGDIDAAIVQAETIARRQIAAIERPALEVASRAGAANRRVIENLTRDLVSFGDERQRFVDQALSRLSEGATSTQRAEVKRLADALYQEKAAHEAAAEALREEQRVRDEGLRVVEATRSPTEDYAASVARLNGLLQAGAIDQETYNRALGDAEGALAGAQDRLLRQSRDWQDGVRRSLQDYVDAATDAASAAEAATTQAFATMEDALVSFATTGKVEFGALTESILADLTRLAVRQAITAPLAGALLGSGDGTAGGAAGSGGLLASAGSLLASFFHEGGVAGFEATRSRELDASVFATAPRFHGGGVAGLAPDELPAVLRRGEA
ncbi:MAG: phage tail tape measure C-terminal domain-containing protein, partial [Geminicoccaceae bacterium]